ncbi:hypothetical protein [Prosthecobacter sp.]|uniref:hypothetical protein n=1 Tax=Prosthecobacter sp. TaxID=1965333 RepID=UPI0037849C12
MTRDNHILNAASGTGFSRSASGAVHRSWGLGFGFLLCSLWLHAEPQRREFSLSVSVDEKTQTASVSMSGRRILDQDLKWLGMPAETQKFSICTSSPELISRKGFAEAFARVPLKEISVSNLPGKDMDFVLAVGDMKGLQRLHMHFNTLSASLIETLGKIQRAPEDGLLELSITVNAGSVGISAEDLLKLDGLAAFTTVRLTATFNAKSLIQLAREQAGKLKHVSVLTSEDMRAWLYAPAASK